MRFTLLVSAKLFLLINMACTPITKLSGYIPLESEMSRLKVGSSTKEEAVKNLGEPLTLRPSPSNSLLYVQQKQETFAFLKPRIRERVVLKLTFNESNILSRKEKFAGLDPEVYVLEKKIVVAEGRKLTFWQQISYLVLFLFWFLLKFQPQEYLE